MQPLRNCWRRNLALWFSIGASGVFLYFAARRVNIGEIRLALTGADLRWVIPMVFISLVAFWIRAIRWMWMFPPAIRPTAPQTFRVFMIGTMTNNFVPGRLGDMARAGVIGRFVPTLGTSGALATVVLEKVADGLVLLTFLMVAFLMAPLPHWLGQVGELGSAIFIAVLLLLLILRTGRVELYGRWPRRAVKKLGFEKCFDSLLPTLRGLVQRFGSGLSILSSTRQSGAVFALTVVIWLVDFSIMFVGFKVFGLSLSIGAAMVTSVLLAVGMMAPAAPGFIGTYQFFVTTGLQLYNVPAGQALALAVFLNLFVVAFTTLAGIISLSREGMSWAGLQHQIYS